mgnify:CR=1 FL=1
MNIFTISFMSLTAVEKCWHFLLATWVLSGNDFDIFSTLENILCKVTDLWSIVFLIDHIKSSNKLGDPLIIFIDSLFDIEKHLINMGLSNNLKSSEYQLKFEMRRVLLQLINDCSNYPELFQEWYAFHLLI